MYDVVYAILFSMQGCIFALLFLVMVVNAGKAYRSAMRCLSNGFVLANTDTITKHNFHKYIPRLLLNFKKTSRELLRMRRVYWRHEPILFVIKVVVLIVAIVVVYPVILALAGSFSFYSFNKSLALLLEHGETEFYFSVSFLVYILVLTCIGFTILFFLKHNRLVVKSDGIHLGIFFDVKDVPDKRFVKKASLKGKVLPWKEIKEAGISEHELFEGYVEVRVTMRNQTQYRVLIGEHGIDDKRIDTIKREILKYKKTVRDPLV